MDWFEEAIKVYTQLLDANLSDNDSRFFLASAYASLKWTGNAIEELRTILLTDPNDVLARHDLALCYRNMGWMKEGLEEMRRARVYSMIYGNPEKKEIVKKSLSKLEQEIENACSNLGQIETVRPCRAAAHGRHRISIFNSDPNIRPS